MKKSLLALSAAVVALSGMAAIPQAQSRPSGVSIERKADLASSLDFLKHYGKSMSTDASKAKKAPAKIAPATDVLTSVEGERQDVSITGSGYMVFFGGIYYYRDETVASHVVYGEDNEVYIYNILPNGTTDTYVKGVKDGDKVVVQLPQTVVWDEEYEDGYNLAMYDLIDDEDGEWYYLADDTSLTFAVAEDGSLTAEGISDDKILAFGQISNDEWSGFGVWDLSIAPFNDVAVELPSDYVPTERFWTIKMDGYGQFVNFAQGGEELYFQGLCANMPEAWTKASIEYEDYTATVSIPQNQFLGTLDDTYLMYTKCGKLVVDEETGQTNFEALPDDYEYQLVWDFEEETMVSKDPDVAFIVSYSKAFIDPLTVLADFTMVHQESFDGTPVNPFDLAYADYLVEDGYAAFTFNIPAMSTEGDCLIPEDLYYVVYVDGEEWTFDAEEYEIEENLEEIPWLFNDYWICYGWYSDIEREVDFFVEGITTLGVQSVYRYDGEETRSEIVSINLDDPTAVAPIAADKKIASVKYYGLDGREVAKPAAGIFVKKVTFEDGSVATFKKAVR